MQITRPNAQPENLKYKNKYCVLLDNTKHSSYKNPQTDRKLPLYNWRLNRKNRLQVWCFCVLYFKEEDEEYILYLIQSNPKIFRETSQTERVRWEERS